MTKKSQARLSRDAAKKADSSWTDLKGIYNACAQAIVEVLNNTVAVYQTPHLTDFVPDRVQTSVTLRGLQRDLDTFTNELTAIYKLHSHRSGGVTDQDDLVETFRIFELYNTFNSRYSSVVLPATIFLGEQATAAVDAMQKVINEQAQKDLLDPNVISDVAVKDPAVQAIPVVS